MWDFRFFKAVNIKFPEHQRDTNMATEFLDAGYNFENT
jgi:hypothetical protein